MASQKALIGWVKKFLYSFLVLWVGGISPLIYAGSFSTHEDVPTYQLSILQSPNRAQKLQQILPKIFGLRQPEWPSGRVTARSQGIGPRHPAVATTIRLLLTALHEGLLPAADITIWHIPALSGRISVLTPTVHSVWLPPPEKPPPFLCSLQYDTNNKFMG